MSAHTTLPATVATVPATLPTALSSTLAGSLDLFPAAVPLGAAPALPLLPAVLAAPVAPPRAAAQPAKPHCVAHEYKLVSLRECPLPETLATCDQPELAARYWREHVTTHPAYNADVECFVVLLLNTRRRVKGHVLVSTGTLDCILVHPREVFRAAIVAAASAVVLMHCHPSGDPAPSEADIRATRELIRAGQLLKIEVLDHVIVGAGHSFSSLRTLGYFYA